MLCDCMSPMASAPTDTASATSGDVVPRRRGRSKAPNFKYDGPVSVIRLELDATDERNRRRLEPQWEAVFRLRRAVQRDAAARCRAYWAAHQERAEDPKALRERLGLTRKGMEAAAKKHIETSGWMRDHLTKAIGLHVADEVWETIDRHLLADASGRRHGPPRVGSWWDFTRIPGPRALAHQDHTYLGNLPAGRHSGGAPGGLPAPAAARAGYHRRYRRRASGRHVDSGPARPATTAGAPSRSGPITMARWRWCSLACPLAMWCCRYGCPKGQASGRTCAISWPTRPCGTRSTWCGCATAKHPVAGATTPIYSSIRRVTSPWPLDLVAPRSPPADAAEWMPTCPTWQSHRSRMDSRIGWSSTGSTAHLSSRRPRTGQLESPGPA